MGAIGRRRLADDADRAVARHGGVVQAASSLPTLAFALIGGVLADLLDRRKVFIAGQSVMLLAAAVLAVCGQLGLLTPWLLLILTFVLGSGAALRLAAYQALVGDLVPREEIPGAVALNSAGFNIARSTGPALGGSIVAAAGARRHSSSTRSPTSPSSPSSCSGAAGAARVSCRARRSSAP